MNRFQDQGVYLSPEGGVVVPLMIESPFSDDKHWCEIGHVLESRSAGSLAKVALHFN